MSLWCNGYRVRNLIRRSWVQTPLLLKCHFYRPQTKFVKVMFLHLSVSHSVHRGEYLGRYTPPGRYTPRQVHTLAGTSPSRYTPWQVQSPLGRYTPPGNACWDTVNKRAVRILLECILVFYFIQFMELDDKFSKNSNQIDRHNNFSLWFISLKVIISSPSLSNIFDFVSGRFGEDQAEDEADVVVH